MHPLLAILDRPATARPGAPELRAGTQAAGTSHAGRPGGGDLSRSATPRSWGDCSRQWSTCRSTPVNDPVNGRWGSRPPVAMRAGAAPAPDGAGFAAVDLALDYPLHEVRRRRAALALSPLGCLPPVGLARQYLPALYRDRLG